MAFNAPFWSPSQASAILFDWDGVIAETRLDFSAVTRKYYGERPAMLLEDAHTLSWDDRASLSRDLEDIELLGAQTARMIPGADAVLDWVKRAGTPWAVVSRNCKKSILRAAEVIGMSMPDIVRSRDDGDCYKPDPRALRETCEALSVAPAQTLLIGDYIYDMMGARRAGMRGALVRNSTEPGWALWLECYCASMDEFHRELTSPRDIVPWEYQETAREYGEDFLRGAHKLTLRLPERREPGVDAWVARAAALGIGGFAVRDAVFGPTIWKQNPSLDPSFMGFGMRATLRAFLLTRWPFASVYEDDGSALDAPAETRELPDFISMTIK
ncbi:MAG: HAD-IA family hydrolase [Synergistaceae bacterium]|jgi:HAD superfamily hydrolase (TIGR01549 family)|nr:HAD-IA family hydrolase [Synergistaceae bacterium]